MNFDEWYTEKWGAAAVLGKEVMQVAYNAAMSEAARLYKKYEGKKSVDEIELIPDSDYQSHVAVDTDSDYLAIVGSGGYIFNRTEIGYSTPSMDVDSARSCYENLRNFFNLQD